MSQIFKTLIDKSKVINYLHELGWTKENHILINKFSFKKAQLEDKLSKFIDFLKPYY